MRFRKWILSAVILLSLIAAPFAGIPSALHARGEETKTVKVGFFEFSGYHIVDQSGRRSGYGYDFLQRLAAFTNWVYEYIGYDRSYAESLEMLKNGEIDVLTSVTKTEEREKDFLFSDLNIGMNSTIFTVKAGNERIVKGDYTTYDGLTIGFLEGNSKNENFQRFAQENGFRYNEKFYAEQDDLSAALQNGEVDGIVTGSLRAFENEWLIESFDSSPFYICVRKDRTDLMAEINSAINEINSRQPDWQNELHVKYYSTDQSGSVVLTSEEREFLSRLESSGTVYRVLMNPDRAPYAYFENGEAKGIFPAIFKTIAERTSIPYEFLPVKDREEYYELRRTRGAEIVLDFTDDFYLAESEGYKITSPFFRTNFTLITRKNFHGEIKTMAKPRLSDQVVGYVGNYAGNVTVKSYKTTADCVKAVEKGDSDATILYSYAAEMFMWEDTWNRLSSALIGEASRAYTFGISSFSDNHLLLSLFNKGIAGMSEGEISAISAQEVNSLKPGPASNLVDFMQQNPVYAFVALFLILLLLFAIAMLFVRTYNQAQLKKKVASATAQLESQKEELSSALHAADAANRSKTVFLNNMSHDIRTPMNAIIGFTALASSHIDNKERAMDYLNKISQASNHLLSLINDVLDMSRIEAGKVNIEERPENLPDILQGLRNIIQSDIHAKHLELFIDTVDVTNEEILCDKLRLNQILLNLTSNAIKFTKPGGSVSVRVTQKPSEREGFGLYEFVVSDTGIGMSPEFAQTVFEPFTRERNSTVSGIQGTGLGMAITKNIVDMMGGSISVHSEQGKGTEFFVNLELKFSDQEQEFSPLIELRDRYALVVDDDMVSCQSVSKMLRKIGMKAEWTLTGKEAIVRTSEAIELQHPFEVYIIDWAMPDMNGIETVKQIRKIIGKDSPIILMSAYDWADIEAEAREAGVTGFISKPLFASDLHRTLERSLGQNVDAPSNPPKDENEIFKGKRILLAEDNELNREIVIEILQEVGLEVESAENGQIACDLLLNAKKPYDLVLMDIQMPVMNGYEAAQKIREMKDPARSNVPILAMTANAFEEDRNAALAAGMNGHLAKPINVKEILSRLRKIFEEK